MTDRLIRIIVDQELSWPTLVLRGLLLVELVEVVDLVLEVLQYPLLPLPKRSLGVAILRGHAREKPSGLQRQV